MSCRKGSLFLVAVAAANVLWATTGCSGGGAAMFSPPSSQSRQALRSLIGRQELALAQGGAQSAPGGGGVGGGPPGGGMAIRPGIFGILLGHGTFTGGFGIATGVAVSPPGRASVAAKTVHYPFIGAFVNRLVAKRHGRNSANRGVITRDETSIYFDEYLALWVETISTEFSYQVRLYEDEAKTKPAGSLSSTYPEPNAPFPQVYHSEFEVTAGTLKGAHGYYDTTINADYSSASSYENSFPDGTHSKGHSAWNQNGESDWSDRMEGAGGYFYQTTGQFRSDGSGHTVSSDSAGYGQEYFYYADGTGRGEIRGPIDGLPAQIVWDNAGKVTITWADGTVEVWNPGTDNSGGGGVTGGGEGSGGGGAPPPNP